VTEITSSIIQIQTDPIWSCSIKPLSVHSGLRLRGRAVTTLSILSVKPSSFQSFTGLGKKECVYISVVAESTLICLLLDVLDGRWLYWYRVVSPRKVSRLASLNRYYITHSFFPRPVKDWNTLTDSAVSSKTVEGFKAAISRD
jgi:hypothetical protein